MPFHIRLDSIGLPLPLTRAEYVRRGSRPASLASAGLFPGTLTLAAGRASTRWLAWCRGPTESENLAHDHLNVWERRPNNGQREGPHEFRQSLRQLRPGSSGAYKTRN